jgi:hypothetical protein
MIRASAAALAVAAALAGSASGVDAYPSCSAPGISQAIDLTGASDLSRSPNSVAAHDAFVAALHNVGVEGFESLTACNTGGCSNGETATFSPTGKTAIIQTEGAVSVADSSVGSALDRPLVGSNSIHISRGGSITFDFGAEGVEAVGFYLNDWQEFGGAITITCASGESESVEIDAQSLCGKSRCDDGAVGWWSTIRDAGNAADRCKSITIDMSGTASDGHRIDELTVGSCSPPPPTPVRRCKAKFADGGSGLCERSGSHALTFGSDVGAWRFATHGLWTVYDDGSAELTGAMTRSGFGTFDLSYKVGGLESAADYCAPNSVDNCGLKFELLDAAGQADGQCYAHNGGGPVDALDWNVFPTPGTGTFSGTGAAAGYEISLAQRGPPLTEGEGAGNKNAGRGISSWFNWTLTQKGSGIAKLDSKTIGQSIGGDINVDLYDCDVPPEEPPIIGLCRCVEVDCTCPAAASSTDGSCLRVEFSPTPAGEAVNCSPRPCPL